MTRRRIIATGALLVFSLLALTTPAAAPKPNFTGSWKMDRARSFGMPGNMQQTMTVTHAGDQIDLETKLIMPDNERTVKDSYVLDGKEHDFTPQAPPNAPGQRASGKGQTHRQLASKRQRDRGERDDYQ